MKKGSNFFDEKSFAKTSEPPAAKSKMLEVHTEIAPAERKGARLQMLVEPSVKEKLVDYGKRNGEIGYAEVVRMAIAEFFEKRGI